MRKYLIVIVASIVLGFGFASAAKAQNINWGAQKKMLKSQQKLESHTLMLQQKNMKHSWKGQRLSSAERTRSSHEMQRARRDLKLRQKDAWQDFKDRQRAGVGMTHS